MQADELKAALKELGWKQTDLARKLEVNPVTISRWATGEPIPPYVGQYLGVMLEISRLYQVHIMPPKLAHLPALDVGEAEPKPVKGRAAGMAKKLKKMDRAGLFPKAKND